MAVPQIIVDASGIRIPSFDDFHTYYQQMYRDIYGADIVITPDSQDGQLIAAQALAARDLAMTALAVYNSFSPKTAVGAGLSRVVKINGLERETPSFSTVDLRIIGQAGSIINGGIAADDAGNKWFLPAVVTIPSPQGEITITAVAQNIGAVEAPSHTINIIATPTRGWQSVDNPSAAVSGLPVESDIQLRGRQAVSTMIPSLSVMEGLLGAVKSLNGVTRIKGYENYNDVADDEGIPAHSISIIVEGGNATNIFEIIAAKKGTGVGTYGDTIGQVVDDYGIPLRIGFFRPILVPITVVIDIRALAGYTSDIEDQITLAGTAYINSRDIGQDVSASRLKIPLSLGGSETFEILDVNIGRDGFAVGAENISIAFNEAPQMAAISYRYRL